MSQTKSDLFVRSEILALLVNTLTANYQYSRSITDNVPLQFQMQLSEKLKTFSAFFITFSESALNFEHLKKKKISFIPQLFPRLLTPKEAFTQMHEKTFRQ